MQDRTLFAFGAAVLLWTGPALSQAPEVPPLVPEIPSTVPPTRIYERKQRQPETEIWGVYSEMTSMGNALSCWVCRSTSAGSGLCPGNVLLPNTKSDRQEKTGATACGLLGSGKCRVLRNYKC